MDETKDKMSTRRNKKVLNPFAVNKLRKRSLVERELETNMTSRMTAPVSIGDRVSTSRYGRARRLVTENENGKVFIETLKPSKSGNTPMKVHFKSPISKPLANRLETPKKGKETTTDTIDNICLENKALSRFCDESKRKNPRSSSPKIYIRKDLIQNRDDDDDVILIKDLFSPKSGKKQKLTQSSSKQQINNASVVKTLDFDSTKGSKRDSSGDKKTANKPNDSNKGSKSKSNSDKNTANKPNNSNKGGKRDSSGDKKTAIKPNDSNKGSKRDPSSEKNTANRPNDSNKGSKRDSSGDKKTAKKNQIASENKSKPNSNLSTVNNKAESKKNNSGSNIAVSDITNPGSPGTKVNLNSRSDSTRIELSSPYQDGEVAWARVGTFAFWPCLITRDPATKIFVRKKLFGRVEHYILHVTFFADNGRRSWVVDNMLRKYTGLEEFISTRKKFTVEDKKKDPRFYAAFFVSEKKQTLWNCAVEEAEAINREPINLRINVFNEMLYESRAAKKEKGGRITRTDSDVSLSESLYDSLFSDDDSKDDSIRSRNRSRNKSLDVSDVVTACLDNMAAKTGNIKIQRQSHMDRWLQIAKSKTPEKVKIITEAKTSVVTPKVEVVTPTDNIPSPFADKVIPVRTVVMPKESPLHHKRKRLPPKEVKITKVYGLRRSYESQNSFVGEETDDKNNESKKNSDKIDVSNAAVESNEQKAPKKNADKKYSNLEVNNTTIAITLDEISDDCNIIPKDEINNDENMESLKKELTTYVEDHNLTVLGSESSYLMTSKNNNSSEEIQAKIIHEKNHDIKPEIMDVFECQPSLNIDREKTNKTLVIESQHQNIDSNALIKNDSKDYVTNIVINNKKRKLRSEEVKLTARCSLGKPYESHGLMTTAEPENQPNGNKNFESKVEDKTEKAIVVLESSNCDGPTDDKIETYSLKESTSSGMESQPSTRMDENKDALLNAIDILLENDAKKADNNAKRFNDIAVVKVTEPQEKTEVLNTKDVDSQDCKVTDNNCTNIETQIIESSSKLKKETNEQENSGADRDAYKTNNDSVEKGMAKNVVNNNFSTDIKNTAELIVVASSRLNLASKSNQADAQKIIPNDVSADPTLHTSPTLKRNEMVSVPSGTEIINCHLSANEKRIESVEYIIKANQLDSNPYIGSELTRDVMDATAKINNNITEETTSTNLDNIPFEKLMSLEIPIISNEELNVAYEENNPVINTEKSCNISNEQNISINPSIADEKYYMTKNDILNEYGHSEKKIEKDLLTKSGHSKPILKRDLLNESGPPELCSKKDHLNDSGHSESLRQIEINHESGTIIDFDKIPECIHFIPDVNKIPENILYNNNDINKVDSTTPDKSIFLDQVNVKKPPDLTSHNLAAKPALLQNLLSNDNDYVEDSDDEPSPEYEPLGDEITEDFRQHMMCIESNITDKNDDAQLVKVCNEIAVLVKSKQTYIKPHVESSSTKSEDIVQSNTENGKVNYEYSKIGLPILTDFTKANLKDFKSQAKSSSSKSLAQLDAALKKYKSDDICDQPTRIDINVTSGRAIKEVNAEILEGLEIINKALENNIKSPLNKKRHSLSFKKANIFQNNPKTDNEFTIVNERYKTIDQIEEIMKNKPKRLPIENGEVQIPEIKENGYHLTGMNTPDHYDDDFDIEEASVNSEDSEVSLPLNNVPARRSLRSKPGKKGGLEDPEFLTYLELRQDNLMEEHPELSLDDIVLYLYKTYAYGQNIKADVEIEEASLAKFKQETSSSWVKSKKQQIQPKNTIKNYFHEKYKNAKKVDFDNCDCDSLSISPVDSGIGNSKDSNGSETPITRKTKSSSSRTGLSPVIMKDVKAELINDVNNKKSGSPKTPKTRRQKKLSPRVLSNTNIQKLLETQPDKRMPVVIISPIKDKHTDHKHKRESIQYELKPKTETELTPGVPIVIISPMKDKLTDTYKHKSDLKQIELKQKTETVSTSRVPVVIISPMEDKPTTTRKHKSKLKNIVLNNKNETHSTSRVPVVIISPMKDKLTVTQRHKYETKQIDLESQTEIESTSEISLVKNVRTETQKLECALKVIERNPKTVMESMKCEHTEKHKRLSEAKIMEAIIETESINEFSPKKSLTERHIKRVTESKNDIIKPKTLTKPMKCERIGKHKRISEANVIEPKIESDSTSELGVSKPKHGVIDKISNETNNIEHITGTQPKHYKVMKHEHERDNMVTKSMDSDSELPLRHLRTKVQKEKLNVPKKDISEFKDEIEETASVSLDNESLLKIGPKKFDKNLQGSYEDPEFLKYQELKQDAIVDKNPQLTQNEITAYLYKTWIYETSIKSDIEKNDDIESSNLIKGGNQEPTLQKKIKRKPKVEKSIELNLNAGEFIAKDKPKRSKTVSRYYNEEFLSDIEDELEVFEVFKTKKTPVSGVSKPGSPKEGAVETEFNEELGLGCEEINTLDEIELYFKQLTSPKPSVFKGLIREKVCEICEDIGNLIKCNVCHGSFHYDCVNKVTEYVQPPAIFRGRKKKKKLGRKPKNLDNSENIDDSQHDISEENTSMEDVPESITMDADTIEAQIEAKMKELLDKEDKELYYDSYSSDDGIDWSETIPGKCELIDFKLKSRSPAIDYDNFKCNNCQMHNSPICFVCKLAISKCTNETRQKCNVLHCNKYYHAECLDHWPQAQFNAGAEWIRSKNLPGTLTCPRHVCHTCVSDDPRGCKTRFCGDKLAKCVRCPATYHSFNKCLPAGTQILTASLIICPRHYEHSPGKIPCHVNTGWCFICALGGSLICCEYCPTSFHAECLNIKPPEGNYMCEDCETGRLPLYGEMVWVKLGHYRWWPGLILHPSEIPDNIMAVKHGLGEFVVRFFGQYDHFWVNRGRVFPYQEGDSGRVSSQKSKIDAAFTTAIEHAQRAFQIRKNTEPNEEESQEIASSLLPPQYVKLKSNKPIGSLLGRRIEDPSLSLTQCECNPNDVEPCGANSQCLNRVLLTECGPTCRAGERCNNRAFEKRQYPKLTAYKAPHRGWGLKALEDIKAGQFVIEYVGELIDEEEFQWRMRKKHEIRDENFYFLTLDKERMIDAGPKGNLARFMNHCCEPNCETQKWTVLGDVRVGLFAINDIKKDSEVTFNYNLECSGIEKKRCLCGAKRCSGYIGAKPKQLDESQRKKNVLTKRKYTKRKNVEESTKIQMKLKRGRPPKPKEQADKHKTLTEIEKDLLIINASVTENTNTSDENKIDFNPTDEVPISDTKESKKPMLDPHTTKSQAISDPNTTAEGTILSSTESTQSKQRRKSINRLDYNTTEVTIPNNTNSKEINKSMIKIDSNTTKEGTISTSEGSRRGSYTIHREIRKSSNRIDSNATQEASISNSPGSSKGLKRKLYCDPKKQVSISGEPSAKIIKYDKPMEVGD